MLSTGSILGCFILPHGTITLDPNRNKDYPELQVLHDSLKAVGEEIFNLKPDLIVLTTPHGIMMSESFGIYLNSNAEGTAEWYNEWKEYSVATELDQKVSGDLLNHMKNRDNVNVQGIIGFAPSEKISLRWGEVIPLWFIHEAYKRNIKTEEDNKIPKSVILTLSGRRYEEPAELTQECFELGKEMANFFLDSNKKVVFVFSGDLAHTHKITKGSFMNKALFEPKEEAHEFDQEIEEWAKDPLKNEETLERCGRKCTEFLSCGYTGFAILHGILKEVTRKAKLKVESKVLCNYHPTYYGMMVAAFNLSQ